MALDFLPPFVGTFFRRRAMRRARWVLATSIYGCHLWNDDPDLGWSAHVTTDGDRDLAARLADELAERLWAMRNDKPPRFLPIEKAIVVRSTPPIRCTRAIASTTGGPAIGGGGASERGHGLTHSGKSCASGSYGSTPPR